MSRGCGTRAEGGLYAVCETSLDGEPIEYFLYDPVIPVPKELGTLRAPLIENVNGVNHLLMTVGKIYYPFVPDFVEEARVMGISKRIPLNFDLSLLQPGYSRLFLVHDRAIQNFEYEIKEPRCPKNNDEPHICIGDLWDLSSLKHYKTVHELIIDPELEEEPDKIWVRVPSRVYTVNNLVSHKPPVRYSKGMFMKSPPIRLEYISKSGKTPKELRERSSRARVPIEVCPE